MPQAPSCRHQSSTCTGLCSSVQLGLAGIVIAMLGALVPASWAAKASTATALRVE
jgi:putative ABC transport system permease protein